MQQIRCQRLPKYVTLTVTPLCIRHTCSLALKIFKNGEVAEDYNGPREAGMFGLYSIIAILTGLFISPRRHRLNDALEGRPILPRSRIIG